eukprot:627554-Amphidinium_carterae.1
MLASLCTSCAWGGHNLATLLLVVGFILVAAIFETHQSLFHSICHDPTVTLFTSHTVRHTLSTTSHYHIDIFFTYTSTSTSWRRPDASPLT